MKRLRLYILIIVTLVQAIAVADEMVIVTDNRYKPFSEELAQLHRRYQKMEVKIVTPEDFLATMNGQNRIFSDNGASFLLFYGDGALPLDETGCGGERFLSDMFWITGHPESILKYRCDATFIGRIPCRRIEDAVAYNKKVRTYFEDTAIRLSCGDVLLIADEDSRGEHLRNSEELASAMKGADYVHVHKVYLDHYDNTVDKAGYAYEALSETLHGGSSLMMYAGHGTVDNITTSLMIDNHRAATLRNKVPPVMFFNACEVGRFSFSENVIAQNLLFNSDGGGIAVIAPSKKTLAGYNQRLALDLIDEWKHSKRGATWCELWTTARNRVLHDASSAINEELAVNAASYNYLGDPALPVYYPADTIPDILLDGNPLPDTGKVKFTKRRNHNVKVEGEGVALLRLYGQPRMISGVECDDNVLLSAKSGSDNGTVEFLVNVPLSGDVAGRLEITMVSGGETMRRDYDVELHENTGVHDPMRGTEIMDFAVVGDGGGYWHVNAAFAGDVPSTALVTVDGRNLRSRVDLTESGGSIVHPIGRLCAGSHEVKLRAGDAEVSETVIVDSPTCQLELITDKEVARGVLEIRIEGDVSSFREGRLVVDNSAGTVYSRLLTPADGNVVEWDLCGLSGTPVDNGWHEMYLIYSFTDRFGQLYYHATDKVPIVVIH